MAYYTLLSSLPHLPSHFDVQRPPITRERLAERLRLLEDDHSEIHRQLVDFFVWDRQPTNRTDEQIIEQYEQLERDIRHPVVLQVVQERMDMRTIVSALRRKLRGDAPPIGVGKLVAPIARNWNSPLFGLVNRYPWMAAFFESMQRGDALEAQRVLFECNWNSWRRLADRFTFSFEAILLYLARWEIIDRWTTRDAQAGRERLDALLDSALGDFKTLDLTPA